MARRLQRPTRGQGTACARSRLRLMKPSAPRPTPSQRDCCRLGEPRAVSNTRRFDQGRTGFSWGQRSARLDGCCRYSLWPQSGHASSHGKPKLKTPLAPQASEQPGAVAALALPVPLPPLTRGDAPFDVPPRNALALCATCPQRPQRTCSLLSRPVTAPTEGNPFRRERAWCGATAAAVAPFLRDYQTACGACAKVNYRRRARCTCIRFDGH